MSRTRVTGRPRSAESLYARELGIPLRKLQRLGGEVVLRAMDADARAILLKHDPLMPRTLLHRGGLAARGYRSKVPGIVTAGYGVDLLTTEEMLDAVRVEGWD